MLEVELDIFSGRANPTWLLSEKDEAELVALLVSDPTLMLPTHTDTGGLGYRGYIIRAVSQDTGAWTKARLPSAFRLGGGYADIRDVTGAWLLDTSEGPDTEVDDYLREYVLDEIESARGNSRAANDALPADEPRVELLPKELGAGQSCASNFFTSSTDFSFWNGSSYISTNNCYNFASNYRSNTIAQPGKKGGYILPNPPTCSNVTTGLSKDGWSNSCLGGTSKNISIALVIYPGVDFHFYRLCTDGRWCHKPGQTAATNKDNSGNYISNVETCNRGKYTTFCGYWYANQSVVVK